MTCLLVFLVLAMTGPLRAGTTGGPAIHFGFSPQVFGEVNENDARAALKIWAESLSTETDIPIDSAPEIFNDLSAIQEALLRKKVDAVTITTAEFWELSRATSLGPIILGRTHGEMTEHYLLLVRRDNPATRLADLRGQSLAVLTGSRANLAPIWMETLLLEEKLGTPDTFWGRTVHAPKITRVLLPVFFRQADACIVTREGFRTMSELNPQVGKQLKILAQSQELVPVVFCLRGDLDPASRDKVLAGIRRISETPSGRQTLVLFQSGQLELRPRSDLDAACALLEHHARLLAEVGRSVVIAPGSAALPGDSERSR